MRPRDVAELIGPRRRAEALSRCVSVADLRVLARRRLPAAVWDFLEGGAEDELTLRRNRAGLDARVLRPRALAGVRDVDLTRTILGTRRRLPFVLGPTGFTRVIHAGGEAAVADAAAGAGVPYTVSVAASNTPWDDLTGPPPRELWLGLYPFRDRGVTRELMDQGREHGCEVLVLTVDVPVAGNRERDLRNGFTIPPRIGPATILDGLRHPRWTCRMLASPPIAIPNVPGLGRGVASSTAFPSLFADDLTWDDIGDIVAQWDGPVVLKGLLTGADGVRAAAVGARAIVVSNHGGRQLDGASASIDALDEVLQRTGGDIEVLVDSGFRRGRDIVAALALGASGVLLGRAYLYGLAAGGRRGVERMVEILAAEIARVLHLCGCAAVDDLEPSLLNGPIP